MENGALGQHSVCIWARCSDFFFYSQAMFNPVDVAYLAIELHPNLHYLTVCKTRQFRPSYRPIEVQNKTPKPRETRAIVRKKAQQTKAGEAQKPERIFHVGEGGCEIVNAHDQSSYNKYAPSPAASTRNT
jgi:hypothetical protein